MKFSEVWRLSGVVYREMVYRSLAEEKGRMWWGAFGRSRQGGEGLSDVELAKRALRIAKFDKVLVAGFNVLVALVPFAMPLFGVDVGVASSVSLSLAVTFGLAALYAIQTLPGFVSAESSVLLSVLPIGRDDFSLVNLFSFVRSMDYMVAGSVLGQAVAVGHVSGSVFAGLLMVLVSAVNVLFAVGVALWFSRVFQRNLVRGGRSKAGSVLRLVLVLFWGLLIVGVGFLFSVPWFVVPNLEGVLVGAGGLSMLLGVVFPFSAGIVVAGFSVGGVVQSTVVLASVALSGYMLLSLLVGRWSLSVVRSISRGVGVRVVVARAVDFSVRVRGSLVGYVFKDLRVASRSPATAFFFALPVLETVIVALLVSNVGVFRTVMVLDAASMGAVFALFLPLALLNAEGRGFEYTKTLPVSSRRIVGSKALVSTLTFVPVPFALFVLSLFKPLSSWVVVFIPFLLVMSVASASVFEVRLFLGAVGKGKIAAIVNDVKKLVVGVVTVAVPQLVYAFVFLWSRDHSAAILVMGAVALGEFGVGLWALKRS